MNDRISRRDRVDMLRECLTGRAAANLPLDCLRDDEEAWQYLQETFGSPHSSINYMLSRIIETPGLTDKIIETDPTHAANWYLDYGNTLKTVLSLGELGPELGAVAYSIPTLHTITSKLPSTMSVKVHDIRENGKTKLEKSSKSSPEPEQEPRPGPRIWWPTQAQGTSSPPTRHLPQTMHKT
jgi:hypothetical protein